MKKSILILISVLCFVFAGQIYASYIHTFRVVVKSTQPVPYFTVRVCNKDSWGLCKRWNLPIYLGKSAGTSITNKPSAVTYTFNNDEEHMFMLWVFKTEKHQILTFDKKTCSDYLIDGLNCKFFDKNPDPDSSCWAALAFYPYKARSYFITFTPVYSGNDHVTVYCQQWDS